MRDVAVVGGGCYGTFYAGQLAKAKERGKARFRRVVVVDRDRACRARLELGETPDRVFVARERADVGDGGRRARSDGAAAGGGRAGAWAGPVRMPSPRVRRRHLRRGRGARGRRAGAGRRRERLGGGGVGGDDLELPRGAELAADRGGNGRHGAAVGVSLPPLPPSAASCRR